MLYSIFKERLENPGFKIFAPDVQTYTASAIKTLGFSSYTSGYWKHGFLCCLQNPAVNNIRNKRMMHFVQTKDSRKKHKMIDKNENISFLSSAKENVILKSG